MRSLLALFLLLVVLQPQARGGPVSGASFGGRAGFRSASVPYSAPRYTAPAPRYSAPAPSYRYTAPARTVIVEHHYHNDSWFLWDHESYPVHGGYSAAGCSGETRARDAGTDRPVER